MLVIVYNVYSQVNQEWAVRMGQAGNDSGEKIAIDKEGNIYIAGTIFESSNNDLIVTKYSSSGQQEWIARYNGPENGNDISLSLKFDNEGNLIVVGRSYGINTGGDYITIKYSSSGQELWVMRYTSQGNHLDDPSSFAIDSSDNIYVTGTSNGNYATLKYDSSGIQRWISYYGTSLSGDGGNDIAIDNSSNVYVTGQCGVDTITRNDICTIKYNSNGVQQWVAKYNGPTNQNDYGLSIGLDRERNVYVCGGSSGNLRYDDYVTVKYNAEGIEQWSRRYSGSANFIDQARSLVVDKSNNIYITGYATEANTCYDFTTIKYNPNGDQLWIAKYNNGLNDFGKKIILDQAGNVYIIGDSDGSGTGFDYATVKYDSSGNQLWAKRYDYSGQYGDYPTAVAVDNNGSIYVTGQSNRDWLTIKYSELTGISSTVGEVPSGYYLSQNYPNPFNPKTVISYQVSVSSDMKLNVYDVLGNEVSTLVNQKQNAGSYQVEFDGSNFSSGIYFYRLEVDGNIVDTKRMILLK